MPILSQLIEGSPEVWGQGQNGGRDALGVTKTPPLLLLNGQQTDFEYVL